MATKLVEGQTTEALVVSSPENTSVLVTSIHIHNDGGAARTITIKNGKDETLFNALPIGDDANVHITDSKGMEFKEGIKQQDSDTGLHTTYTYHG